MRNRLVFFVVSGVLVLTGCASPGLNRGLVQAPSSSASSAKNKGPYDFPASPQLDPVAKAVYEAVKASEGGFASLQGEPWSEEKKEAYLARIEKEQMAGASNRDQVLEEMQARRKAEYYQPAIGNLFKGAGVEVIASKLTNSPGETRSILTFTLKTKNQEMAEQLARSLNQHLRQAALLKSKGWEWHNQEELRENMNSVLKESIERDEERIERLKEKDWERESNRIKIERIEKRLKERKKQYEKVLSQPRPKGYTASYKWISKSPKISTTLGLSINYNGGNLKIGVSRMKVDVGRIERQVDQGMKDTFGP
ncbi:hypothetical protein [Thiohalorhabdus methylotrophus]|uniref:LPP20 lipoprotein n=1 Tax=Thiohalorhabdus methylotrophus TaxID=3242694 RepID=A0ABV4U1K3_9GAMM